MENKFRLNAINVLLTYPQCPLAKEEVYDFLVAKFDPQHILVAHEKHADGSPHLHAFLRFKNKINTRNCRFADLDIGSQTYHGKYESCRQAEACRRYAAKGGDFIANFDVQVPLSGGLREWASDQIVHKKRRPCDLLEEQPKLLFGYNTLVQDVNTYLRDIAAKAIQQLPYWLPNPWGKVLCSQIKGKRRHYWLWSSQPNVGKTFLFAKPLHDEFGAVVQSGDFTYWNVTQDTNCVVLDEYNTALLKYSSLNSMCDGHFGYRIFRGGIIQLLEPLIIVLSNQSIDSLYPFMNQLLHARFKEIKLD